MSIKSTAKKVWKKVTGAVIALLVAIGLYNTPVESQTPTYTVSLTLPNQNTDGSALALSGLASYTVAYKLNGAATYTVKTVNGPFVGATQTTTIPKAFGTTCANAYVTATNGSVSAATSPDVCSVATAPPNPPSNVSVQ